MTAAINTLRNTRQHRRAALIVKLQLAQLNLRFYRRQGCKQFMCGIGGKALLAFQRHGETLQ